MKKQIFVLLFVLSFSLNAQQLGDFSEKQGSLSTMQPISVTIGGNFIVTGSFVASRLQRLDQFISTIFIEAQQNILRALNQNEGLNEVKNELNSYPLRGIILKRANGQNIRIDLLRFRLTGDFKDNPYLTNDDVIIFPSFDKEKSIIDVVGAVNKQTKFQFVDGDKLSDAILFSGGLNTSYDNITKAEISRLDKTGNNEVSQIVNISEDITLKCGDRIRILSDENQKKDYKILVLGQVHTPGFIHVTRTGVSISDVIQKAGGFTENADLRKADLIRDYSSIEMLKKHQLMEYAINSPEKLLLPEAQLKQKQLKDMLELSRVANITEEDSLFFRIDSQLRTVKSESYVDFTKLSDINSDDSKFLVKDGDLILVPDKFDYIYVFGQVAKVGYVKYRTGENYNYYIQKAGGVTETARDVDESVIIKGKELNWIDKQKDKVNIEPGDYIYVPKSVPRSFWYTMSKIGTVTSIIGSVATILLLIVQFGK